MPARVQNHPSELLVTFERDGEQPTILVARDPVHAWETAVNMLSHQSELRHGDALTVRRTIEVIVEEAR
jgi:hypothetical protein